MSTSIFSTKAFLSNTVFTVLCLISFLLLNTTFGQNRNEKEVSNKASQVSDINNPKLPDKVGDWSAIGAARTLSADQISALPDGDVYTEYGLQTLTVRFYTDGKTKLAVELFQTHFASEAYGLFTFIRSYLPPKRQSFQTGHFLASVSGEVDTMEVDHSLIDSLKGHIVSDEGEMPSLPFNLPGEHKINNTDKYIVGPVALGRIKEFADLKDVVNFAGGTQAVAANYQNGNGQMSLIIFEFHTPQLATDGNAQIQNHLEALPVPEGNLRLLKRIGNYIVVATNVQDTPSAEGIIAKVRYSPKVYWEGKKITNIPLQFRPPDPIVMEEASQTANMIIRTFYWIGVMISGAIIMGFIAGSSLYYWNRYRWRKFGSDEAFSDADGSVRLHLNQEDNNWPRP
ncbi:MAG: DUF6599 family protein [Acidobacteriota bacterium]